MVSCPKCGGDMREGQAFVQVKSAPQTTSGLGGMMGIPSMGLPSVEMSSDESMQWREKTGRTSGRLIKRDEEKTMKIYGRRCSQCGYIEFYVQE